ncbi:MAG: hypothetical protein R2766_02645 [Saprospiraceae bacterium]
MQATVIHLLLMQGLTGYQWYCIMNRSPLAGETNQTLTVDSNTPGMEDGMEEFYYVAFDMNSCPGELCCPVTVVTEPCIFDLALEKNYQ